jgi:hypothetical protein
MAINRAMIPPMPSNHHAILTSEGFIISDIQIVWYRLLVRRDCFRRTVQQNLRRYVSKCVFRPGIPGAKIMLCYQVRTFKSENSLYRLEFDAGASPGPFDLCLQSLEN